MTKVLVLGLSKSGIAAAKFLNRHGYDVYLTESKNVEADPELESLGIKIETGDAVFNANITNKEKKC